MPVEIIAEAYRESNLLTESKSDLNDFLDNKVLIDVDRTLTELCGFKEYIKNSIEEESNDINLVYHIKYLNYIIAILEKRGHKVKHFNRDLELSKILYSTSTYLVNVIGVIEAFLNAEQDNIRKLKLRRLYDYTVELQRKR